MEHLSGRARADLTGGVHGVDRGEFPWPLGRRAAQTDTAIPRVFQAFTLSPDQIGVTVGLVLPDQVQNLICEILILKQCANPGFSFL